MSSTDQREIIAKLCESLLEEMEAGAITLEQSLYKALRIARLVNDTDKQKWIRLELAGYHRDRLPVGITISDAEKAAYISNRQRNETDKDTKKVVVFYATESVPVLEAAVAADKLAFQQTVMPSQVNPIQQGFTTETYASVFATVTQRQNALNQDIKRNQSYLARCRVALHSYIFTLYYRYRFDSVSESAFQQLKDQVDDQLSQALPDALQQFSSAYDRLGSENATEFSQALSTSRNILYAFADYVFPPQKESYRLSDGTEIEVNGGKHRNRILAFLDKNMPKSDNSSRLTKTRIEELFGRIGRLHDLLSEGTKNTISVKDARLAVVDTYLLLGQLMDYLPSDAVTIPQSSTTLTESINGKSAIIPAKKIKATKKVQEKQPENKKSKPRKS